MYINYEMRILMEGKREHYYPWFFLSIHNNLFIIMKKQNREKSFFFILNRDIKFNYIKKWFLPKNIASN